MIRDGSLTMADVVWYAHDPGEHQCLITWEIFGGGIMGNLLTDTHEAELSLWPDSRYHIQVTCKNKVCIKYYLITRKTVNYRYLVRNNLNLLIERPLIVLTRKQVYTMILFCVAFD